MLLQFHFCFGFFVSESVRLCICVPVEVPMCAGVSVCGSCCRWCEAVDQHIRHIVFGYSSFLPFINIGTQFTLCVSRRCQTLDLLGFVKVVAALHVRMFPHGVIRGAESVEAGALLGGSVGVSSLNASDWRSAEKTKCTVFMALPAHGTMQSTPLASTHIDPVITNAGFWLLPL